MSNILKMALLDSIRTLYRDGWTRRRIARELGIHRGTVNKYIALVDAGVPKPATVTAGDTGEGPPIAGSKPATVTAGVFRCESLSRPYDGPIRIGIQAGLTAQRIWQDLKAEHGFTASYESVKRYVHRLTIGDGPERVYRMECQPGEELQLDYGTGYWLVGEKGRKRKVHILRLTLSFSRKSYSEAMLHQDAESFLRCMENAFRAWGGVSQTAVSDNLKAVVLQADWYDPSMNPKLAEFARHYGFTFVPTRPKKPEHKGKTESAVKYVKNNALKGRVFTSLAAINEHLRSWEVQVADQRIHGTTRQQVKKLFEQERPRLKPLPDSLFPCYREGQRHVHRDSFVEVEGAYYHVPPEHIGRLVWVRYDAHMVRVLSVRMEPIASHPRRPRGTFSQVLGAQGRPAVTLEENQRYLEEQAGRLGSHVRAWAEAVFHHRKIEGFRAIRGLIALGKTHRSADLDQACSEALERAQWRLREIKYWLQNPQSSQATSFSFLETHPLIRDMDAYDFGSDAFPKNQFPSTLYDPNLTDPIGPSASSLGTPSESGSPSPGSPLLESLP